MLGIKKRWWGQERSLVKTMLLVWLLRGVLAAVSDQASCHMARAQQLEKFPRQQRLPEVVDRLTSVATWSSLG